MLRELHDAALGITDHEIVPQPADERLAKFFAAIPTNAVEPVSHQMEAMYGNVQGNITPKLNFLVHSQRIAAVLRR